MILNEHLVEFYERLFYLIASFLIYKKELPKTLSRAVQDFGRLYFIL